MSSSTRIVDTIAGILGVLGLLLWVLIRTIAKILDYLVHVAMSVLCP
jgi:hypothetical protein